MRVIDRLRRLVAWYEWGGSSAVLEAGAAELQAAADALDAGEIDEQAARLLLYAWRPFGYVRKPEQPHALDDDEAQLQRAVVAQMARRVREETQPSRRAYLARLLHTQTGIFSGDQCSKKR